MKADPETQAMLTDVLERFCDAFARREREGILDLFAPDDDVSFVTSEQWLLRGRDQLTAFLDEYAQGSTTYSWAWAHLDCSATQTTAWILADGTETATVFGSERETPYRMTVVFERTGSQWLIRQIHGSSPHQP